MRNRFAATASPCTSRIPAYRAMIVAALAAFVFAPAAAAQAPQPDKAAANYQAKGEQDKSYVFPGTTESIAYHIYVPQKWTPGTRLPLVILTHGANQPATAPFQRPMQNPTLAKMAEARGFIVAAVTGYHANATGVGGWNVPYPMVQVPRAPRAGGAAAAGRGAPDGARPAGAPAAGAGRAGGGGRGPAGPPATAEDFQRAEQDILNVRSLMLAEYNADPSRVYLMGNSSGGSAVWNVAAKYPELWTAISPSAAPLEDASFPYEKLKSIPVLVVHGDMDTTMVFEGSRVMVDHAKAKGVNATWLPVPGGAHTDAWALPDILKQTFDFYDRHAAKGR
jgi:poly(3-hydroxybutyrate) depolymerase